MTIAIMNADSAEDDYDVAVRTYTNVDTAHRFNSPFQPPLEGVP